MQRYILQGRYIQVLYIAKRVKLRSSHHKKNILQLCVVTDVSWIYQGDHFAEYTNIESLCGIPKTNKML